MPEQQNRSPCPRLLREHASPPAEQSGIRLSERLAPDRGNATLREEKRGGKVVTLVDVNVATAGRVNRNRRLYPREVWQAAIEAAQPELAEGKLWGLVEHPEDSFLAWDPLKGRLENIWVLYEKLWLEGDQVRATGVVIETAAGGDMKALLSARLAVGISSNGLGSAKSFKAKEIPGLEDYPDPEAYIEVIQDDFRLLTIDAVSDPSDLSGTARQKETLSGRSAPPPTAPRKEGPMHKLLKALMEKFPGKTLEQIKAEHAGEYLQTLEAIAEETARETPPPQPAPVQTPAPVVTPPAAPPSNAESTLEQNVLALSARLEASERRALAEKRTNIAITALEAAQLPRAPKVGDLDLDARFREQLITAALTAQDDAEAKALVDQMIEERRALMGATQQRPRTAESVHVRAAGVSLPAGNNAAPSRQTEGVNPVASLRGSLGLK